LRTTACTLGIDIIFYSGIARFPLLQHGFLVCQLPYAGDRGRAQLIVNKDADDADDADDDDDDDDDALPAAAESTK